MFTARYRRAIVAPLVFVIIILSACVPLPQPVAESVETSLSAQQVDIFSQQLAHGDITARVNAAYALGQLGVNAAPYVPNLLAATQDPDSTVRAIAAFTLGKIRTPAELIASRLLQLLTNPNEPTEVRYSAIRALGYLGEPDPVGIAVLSALLARDPDEHIRWAAVDALAHLGAIHDSYVHLTLMNALVDPNWYVANQARELLSRSGDAGVALLMENFQKSDIDWDQRNAILSTLTHMPDAALPRLGEILAGPPSTADLLKALSAAGLSQMGRRGIDEIATVAMQSGKSIAIEALPQFGESAIPVLNVAVAVPTDFAMRKTAIQALGTVGALDSSMLKTIIQNAPTMQRQRIVEGTLAQMGDQAVPLLLDLLNEPAVEPGVQKAIIIALGKIKTRATTTVPSLVAIIQDPQIALDVRVAAIEALGDYSTAAGEAAPALQKMLQVEGTDRNLQASAVVALGKIGPGRPELIADFLAILATCDATASNTGQALGEMNIGSQEVISGLITALDCPNPAVQAAAAEALGRIAPLSAQVVDKLAGFLPSDDGVLAAAAATALGRLGPGALPTLMSALTITNTAEVSQHAADALVRMGAAAAPTLVQLLTNESVVSETHVLASKTLIRIGPATLPFLIPSLRQSEAPARQRILNTLYGIGPRAFEGFQWALQDPTFAADRETIRERLNTIYGQFVANDDATEVSGGFAISEALPFLVTALRPVTASLDLRRQVARAIAFTGPEAEPATPLLALAVMNSDLELQCNAALALLLIGSKTAAAVPALATALAAAPETALCKVDSDMGRMLRIRKPTGYQLLLAEKGDSDDAQIPLQHLLLYNLIGLGPAAEAAIPELINTLKRPTLRRLAAEALGQIGAAVHPALLELLQVDEQLSDVPGLAEALAGMNSDLRRSAAYALRQSNAALDSFTSARLLAIAQNKSDDLFVRTMLALALAAHSQPIPEFWEENGLISPLSVSCPWWPTMGNAGVLLTGFDLYTDLCVYTSPADAPTWDEIYNWIMSSWG